VRRLARAIQAIGEVHYKLGFYSWLAPKYDPDRFLSQMNEMVGQIKQAYRREENIVINDELGFTRKLWSKVQGAIQTLGCSANWAI